MRSAGPPAVTGSHLEQVGQARAQLGVDSSMDGVSTISWDKPCQSSIRATLKECFPAFRWNSIRAVSVLALPGFIPGLCFTGSLELGPAPQRPHLLWHVEKLGATNYTNEESKPIKPG